MTALPPSQTMDWTGLALRVSQVQDANGAVVGGTQQSAITVLTDSSGGATGNNTLAAVVTQTALTDSSGGAAADGTLAAQVTQTAITDNAAGATADGTIAAITDLSTAGGNTYSDSAVNLKLVMVRDAVKELSTTANLHTTALNTLRDNVTDAGAKVNLLVTAVNTQRDNISDLAAKVNAILAALSAYGVTA